MWFGIVSLFPEMFLALHYGITGRAIRNGLLQVQCWNPRDFSEDPRKRVDDRPYGGGPGMIMQVQPIARAIAAAKRVKPNASVMYLSPQGRLLTQSYVQELAGGATEWILLSGRYEGIDERLLATQVDSECSIGDYVLSGGEIASLALIDAVTRCLPGALGHPSSAAQDSFSGSWLEYPQYTRPEVIDGMRVPEVLLSGDHAAVERWRLKQSLGRTWLKRPELFNQQDLSAEHKQLLIEFIAERKI